MNAMNAPSLPRNHSIDEIAQQKQQASIQPHPSTGLWDLPIPPAMPPTNQNPKLPLHNLVPSSSMKTELQIIEHLHAKAKEDQFKFDHMSQQKPQQILHPPIHQQVPHQDAQSVNI